MANYLLLYTGTGEARGADVAPDPEAMQAVMAAWGAWMGQLGENLIDGGNPFNQNQSTISPDGSVGAVKVPHATGYGVISADSLDAAIEMAKGCPVLTDGGSVSVMETFEIPM